MASFIQILYASILGKKNRSYLLKTDTQLESCEVSFLGGEMRTAAQETVFQIALRDGCKAAVGEGPYIRFW